MIISKTVLHASIHTGIPLPPEKLEKLREKFQAALDLAFEGHDQALKPILLVTDEHTVTLKTFEASYEER